MTEIKVKEVEPASICIKPLIPLRYLTHQEYLTLDNSLVEFLNISSKLAHGKVLIAVEYTLLMLNYCIYLRSQRYFSHIIILGVITQYVLTLF